MTARPRWPALNVALAATLAVAVVGVITGIEGTERSQISFQPPAHDAVAAREGRSYRDLRDRDFGPNRDLPVQWFRAITEAPGTVEPYSATPVTRTDADREAALALRASRRAYDGAPPVVPHAVDQLAVPSCLTCHERGARVSTLNAPVMSHARHDSCLQCHVAARDPVSARATPSSELVNEFVGARTPRGTRAWEGAPPTIPHTTWMRDRCASCHGSGGPLGLRTSHPWRASCTQCHAPSADLDQRPRGVP